MELDNPNRPASQGTPRKVLPRLPNRAQRNGTNAETQENEIMEGEEDDKSSATSRETSPVRSSETEESSKESEPEKVPKKGIFWRPKTNLAKSKEPTDATAIDAAEESGIKPALKTVPNRNKRNKESKVEANQPKVTRSGKISRPVHKQT